MAFSISSTCFKCNGIGVWVRNTVDGDVPIDPCPVCQGSGLLQLYSVDLDNLEEKVENIAKNLKDVEKTCEKILKIADKQP